MTDREYLQTLIDNAITSGATELRIPAGSHGLDGPLRISHRARNFRVYAEDDVQLMLAPDCGNDCIVIGFDTPVSRCAPLVGDIDEDGEVTVFDYDRLSAAYDSTPHDAHWDAAADLDGDGQVTAFDADRFSNAFGSTYAKGWYLSRPERWVKIHPCGRTLLLGWKPEAEYYLGESIATNVVIEGLHLQGGGIHARFCDSLLIDCVDIGGVRAHGIVCESCLTPSVSGCRVHMDRTLTWRDAGEGYAIHIHGGDGADVQGCLTVDARSGVILTNGARSVWISRVSTSRTKSSSIDCHGNAERDVQISDCINLDKEIRLGNTAWGHGPSHVSIWGCRGIHLAIGSRTRRVDVSRSEVLSLKWEWENNAVVNDEQRIQDVIFTDCALHPAANGCLIGLPIRGFRRINCNDLDGERLVDVVTE